MTSHCFTGFRLVDIDGDDVSAGELGLLLYNGGTVCDDGFGFQSAGAICRKLGYSGSSNWTSGYYFLERQQNYDIKLDDVRCRNSDWEDCTYSTRHNCGHSEDVFLTCTGGNCIQLFDLQNIII